MDTVRITGSNGSPIVEITETTLSGSKILYTHNIEDYYGQVFLEGSVTSNTEQELIVAVSGSEYGLIEAQKVFIGPRQGNVEILPGKILLSSGESLHSYSPTSGDSIFLKGYVNGLKKEPTVEVEEEIELISSLLEISGCIGYWKADTEVSHSGGSLTFWGDQTSFGNDLFPTNGSTCDANLEPSWGPLNNQPVVVFSGSTKEGMWKENTSGSINFSGMTFVCVLDPGTGSFAFSPGILMYGDGLQATPPTLIGFLFANESSNPGFFIRTNNQTIYDDKIGNVTGSLWLTARWDAISGSVEVWANSILITSSLNVTSSIPNNLDFLVNIRNNIVDTVANTRIAEAAIYNEYIQDNSIQKISKYFENKFNIISGSTPT